MSKDIQKSAIESIDQNTFVSAGAGTGKTHVLVQRFVELLAQNKAEVSEIAAITFTEKAAKEMKDRIRNICAERAVTNPIWQKYKVDLENSRIGTIHGFCARILKENSIELGIDPLSDILDEIESLTLLDKTLHSQILSLLEKEDPSAVFMISDYGLRETENILRILFKNRLDIDDIIYKISTGKAQDKDTKSTEVNNHIINIYKIIKKELDNYKGEEGLLDFNDLIIYTKQLLANSKPIRRHYQKIIKYILVDEYQDTDTHQKDIIFYLAEDGSARVADNPKDIVLSKDKLFIVGDSKQSIYRFRGADVGVFEETKKIFKKNGIFFDLQTNMRSLPEHIVFFNTFFGDIMGRDESSNEDYESTYADIHPLREISKNIPSIEFLNIQPDEEDIAENIRRKEAVLIARKILRLTDNGFQFKDMAILFRAMTDIKIYEDIFRKLNLPYYVIAGSGFFARQEVKDILNFLKVIDNENDKIALAGVLRSPMFGLSDNDLYWWSLDKKTPPEINLIKNMKDSVPISALIEKIISSTNYRAILATQYMGEQRILNINKLTETARRFEKKGIFTLTDFVKYIGDLVINEAREGEAAISEEESNAIKIMTIHKAKGLEFPVVIIPDVHRRTKSISGPVLFDKKFAGFGIKVKDVDGEFQETALRKLIKEEIEKKELAESKRLLYVASTRVKDYLIFSGDFNSRNNNWAIWLSNYIKINKPKLTAELPEIAPKKAKSVLAVTGRPDTTLPTFDDIIKQTRPLSDYQKTKLTATEARFKGPELAIETHKFFKHWDFSENNMPKNEDIKKFVINFMRHPIYGEIKSALVIEKELPITYKHDEGIMEGVIDLLYKKKDGNWVLLDYKTDNITKDEAGQKAKQYETQIMRYTKGIEKIMGIILEKKIIFFLAPGIAIPL